MRTKAAILVFATAFWAGSLSAEQAPVSAISQVKSSQQIRCELLDDCKPIPPNRAWITRTGGVETDRVKIIRAQQVSLTNVKRGPTVKPGANGGPKLAITPIKSSDLFINFTMASWDIDDVAFEQASELYSALTPQEWGAYRFEIAGHTDAVGGVAQNKELSMKRAQAVVDLLIARGVKRSQLDVKGYGFQRPIQGIDRIDGKNRRVEIIKLP